MKTKESQKQMSWEDAIRTVLTQAKAPMSYVDIANKIIDQKLRSTFGRSPAITVVSIIRNSKLKDDVYKTERGKYCLKQYATKLKDTPSPSDIELQEDSDEEEKEFDDLITAYGRFWSRDMFEDNQKKLYGSAINTAKANYDFSKDSGIYLLHKGYTVVYAGQADSLSKRIAVHTQDLNRGRWDNFSWFSISNRGEDTGDNNKSRNLSVKKILDTLEALLIETLGPERNKKGGNGFADKEIMQIKVTDYVESIQGKNSPKRRKTKK